MLIVTRLMNDNDPLPRNKLRIRLRSLYVLSARSSSFFEFRTDSDGLFGGSYISLYRT